MITDTGGSTSDRIRYATPGSVVVRLAMFGLLWWALSEADPYNWWFGIFMVIAATLMSLVMLPAAHWSATGIARFVPFFVSQSIRGGVDVARRAFHPELPLDPGFVEVPLRLPDGPARVFLANTMSLLPGTVSVELEPSSIRLHALDRTMPIEHIVLRTEERIADIIQVELDEQVVEERGEDQRPVGDAGTSV